MATKSIPNRGTESKQVLFRKMLRQALQVQADAIDLKVADLNPEQLEGCLIAVKNSEGMRKKMPTREAFLTQFNLVFKKELLVVANATAKRNPTQAARMGVAVAHLEALPDEGADEEYDHAAFVLGMVTKSSPVGMFRFVFEGFEYHAAIDKLITEGKLVEKTAPTTKRPILYTPEQDKAGFGGWATVQFPLTPGCVVIVDMNDPYGPRIISEHVNAQVAGRIRDQKQPSAKLYTAADYEALPWHYAGDQPHQLLSERLATAQATADTISSQTKQWTSPPAPVLGLDVLADLANRLRHIKRGTEYAALMAEADKAGYYLRWKPYDVPVTMAACHESDRVKGEQWGVFQSKNHGVSTCLLSLLWKNFDFCKNQE